MIEVSRIAETIARTARFSERVYTDAERAYCESKGAAAAQSYAARFAAKEAAMKALRTGWSGSINWHDIEVFHDKNKAPCLEIRGEAKKILDNLGADAVHLSMSHTTEHAIATVILEKV